MVTGRRRCDVRSGPESPCGRLVDTFRFQTLIIQRGHQPELLSRSGQNWDLLLDLWGLIVFTDIKA